MRNIHSVLSLLSLSAVAGLGLASCSSPGTSTAGRNSFSFDPPAKPPSNPGNVTLKLSTSAQRLYVVEGNEVLLATPVCVGVASTPTPKGHFRIRSKNETRRRQSQPGAGYPMPYWLEFYSPAYGMHWGFVKPYPATHGCVRMPLKAARKVFHMVHVGTPLHVASSQPWDETIGKTLPVLDDSSLPDPPNSYMLSTRAMQDIKQGNLWNF